VDEPASPSFFSKIVTGLTLAAVAAVGLGTVSYVSTSQLSSASAADSSVVAVAPDGLLEKTVGEVIPEDEEAFSSKLDERSAALAESSSEIQAFAKKIKDASEFQWPTYTKGEITVNSWGNRLHPIYHVIKFHNGTDFPGNKCGQPIYAIQKGKVTTAEMQGGSGNTVIIEHGDILGTEFTSQYMHMSSFAVKKGDTVSRGQWIGNVGSTGTSTECHLHLSLWADGVNVDPMKYVKRSTWETFQGKEEK
ncbi:MAG: M23 family metallopeptidase, partial [Propionibacteriaceae bacterium]|nr:M23 family metallopeptidase [Propionibacteriaceae bacterium]